MSSSFGFELLFQTVSSNLKGKTDVLACYVHWKLISNGYRCIGVGDELGPVTDDTKSFETLPAGWNESQDLYTLKYVHNKRLHLLKLLRLDKELMVNFFRVEDELCTSAMLDVDEFINNSYDECSQAVLNVETLDNRIHSEILQPLVAVPSKGQNSGSEKKENTRNETDERQQRSVLEERDPLRVPPNRYPLNPTWTDVDEPLSVGRGDLDPLGRGGGMLMDPRHPAFTGRYGPGIGVPGNLPRGAVPPGARFDPFGPPDPNFPPQRPQRGHFGEPGADHLPPPGFDDMFL